MFVHFPCVGNVSDSKETKFQIQGDNTLLIKICIPDTYQ